MLCERTVEYVYMLYEGFTKSNIIGVCIIWHVQKYVCINLKVQIIVDLKSQQLCFKFLF